MRALIIPVAAIALALSAAGAMAQTGGASGTGGVRGDRADGHHGHKGRDGKSHERKKEKEGEEDALIAPIRFLRHNPPVRPAGCYFYHEPAEIQSVIPGRAMRDARV